MLHLLYHIGNEGYIIYTCPFCYEDDTYMNNLMCNNCYYPIPNVDGIRNSVEERLKYHKE